MLKNVLLLVSTVALVACGCVGPELVRFENQSSRKVEVTPAPKDGAGWSAFLLLPEQSHEVDIAGTFGFTHDPAFVVTEVDEDSVVLKGMATFKGYYHSQDRFGFVAPKALSTLIIDYKAHSQSLTNYKNNRVDLAVKVDGTVVGTSSDQYSSETSWGPVTGVWHSRSFASTVEKNATVIIEISVAAGDYVNWVSSVVVYGK